MEEATLSATPFFLGGKPIKTLRKSLDEMRVTFIFFGHFDPWLKVITSHRQTYLVCGHCGATATDTAKCSLCEFKGNPLHASTICAGLRHVICGGRESLKQ